jgi:alkylhydroperoxidase family enzyme
LPRISYVDPSTVDDPEIVEILERARREGTPRPESQAVRAHNPEVMKAFNYAWETFFRRGLVDHRIKELCRLFVAKSVECEYCAGQRSVGAIREGLTEHQVDEILLFERSDQFDNRERTALLWTKAIVWDSAFADDELWRRLHEQFTEAQLVELGHFVALTLGQQRFLKTLDLGHQEILGDTAAGLAPGSPRGSPLPSSEGSNGHS